MQRTFLNAKLHQAIITGADLDYEGSFGIDQHLLDEAGILPGEQVHVYNITNGQRFITYAISKPAGSREMVANGACAHLVTLGDQVIICTYAALDQHEVATHTAKVLLLDGQNNIRERV